MNKKYPELQQYTIMRYYANGRKPKPQIYGLTLEQAQEHCNNPETSYKNAKNPANNWFDGYIKQ